MREKLGWGVNVSGSRTGVKGSTTHGGMLARKTEGVAKRFQSVDGLWERGDRVRVVGAAAAPVFIWNERRWTSRR